MAGNSARGFTLIEVLTAVVIIAVALTALMGRIGASADIQYELDVQAKMLEVATTLLQEQSMAVQPLSEEKRGRIELQDAQYQWRLWSEKTAVDGFVRYNVAVSMTGQPELLLSRYKAIYE